MSANISSNVHVSKLYRQDKQEAVEEDEVEAAIKAVNDRLGILPSIEKGIKLAAHRIIILSQARNLLH